MNLSTLSKPRLKAFLAFVFIFFAGFFAFLLFNGQSGEGNQKFNFTSVSANEKVCYQSVKDSEGYSNCMIEIFDSVAKAKGVPFSIGLINNLADKTSGMHNMCHAVSHAVGKYFYIKYGDLAYTGNYAACSQGYAHGLMQGAAESENVSELSKAVLKICAEPSVGAMSGCVHGAGHAAYDAKMPLMELEKTCKNVIPKLYDPATNAECPRGQINCIEGWSMELANSQRDYFDSKKDLADALKPCNNISGYYKFGCTTSFARQYIVKTSNSSQEELLIKFRDYRKFCSVYKEEIEIYLCDFYLGSAIGDIFNNTLPDKEQAEGLMLGCGINLTPESICLRGFANNILSLNGNDIGEANRICSFMRSDFAIKSCFKGFEEEAKTYNR